MNLIYAVVLLNPGAVAATTADAFERLGFEVQVVPPSGLVIGGASGLFERRFLVRLRAGHDGVWVEHAGRHSRTLPAAALPAAVRAEVQAIEFEAPPAFGPGNP